MSDTKSAIDEIFKISENLESVTNSIKILEKNIKSLNSKFIILTKKIDSIEESSQKQEEKGIPRASAPGSSNEATSLVKKEETNDKLVLGSVKTYGYIANKDRVPIPNIKVSIFDNNEDRIRNIKTNSDGYWEARLPSGNYKIIYSHEKFNDIVKDISIPKGSINFRVT